MMTFGRNKSFWGTTGNAWRNSFKIKVFRNGVTPSIPVASTKTRHNHEVVPCFFVEDGSEKARIFVGSREERKTRRRKKERGLLSDDTLLLSRSPSPRPKHGIYAGF